MAVNPQSPGVYIDEIPVFPASIAGVATAIPAFIGYVEKAENNGIGIPPNTPTRITSLLEYETMFGKAEGQDFSIDINDNTLVTPAQRTITVVKNAESQFKMYYNMQMYFSNGGGPCYIVPVGLYSNAFTGVKDTDMLSGLSEVAKVDEPTLLLFPDAVSLLAANRKNVYDAALAQCEKLKDRFTIMDVVHTPNNSVATDASDFRNSGVGPDNLKYGASYYPFINTTLGFGLNENLLYIRSQTVNGVSFNANTTNTIALLTAIEQAIFATQQGLADAKIEVVSFTTNFTATYKSNVIAAVVTNINTALALSPAPAGAIVTAITTGSPSVSTIQTYASGTFTTANTNYIGTQNKANADALLLAYNQLLTDLSTLRGLAYTALGTLSGYVIGSLTNLKNTIPAVYNSISSQINAYSVQLNPSGAIAGIYAAVDNQRGVWKAPANVGVATITGPSINITTSEQDGLNIDATSGKSINAIRSFTGRGTLVWGARTLAGNDNEWRYINVRRLFIYVEESVKDATEFVVFEANTANTWQRVKGMIEAFLTGLWRDGALAGATTKDAFFVNVGLGVTMTAQDILEGRLIVVVGMAAVRPAEFIILQFEHKLQVS
ncbi:MAG: phage tail sheath family protein [Bacteroidia bacterium]